MTRPVLVSVDKGRYPLCPAALCPDGFLNVTYPPTINKLSTGLVIIRFATISLHQNISIRSKSPWRRNEHTQCFFPTTILSSSSFVSNWNYSFLPNRWSQLIYIHYKQTRNGLRLKLTARQVGIREVYVSRSVLSKIPFEVCLDKRIHSFPEEGSKILVFYFIKPGEK